MPDPSQPLAGTLDIAIATKDGDVFHAVRHPDGTWQPFEPVFRHTSAGNAVSHVNIAMNRNGSGIFATVGGRSLLQRFRPRFSGGWQPPVTIAGGIDINHFAVDASATDGGIIAVTGAPGPSRFLSTYFDRFSYEYAGLGSPGSWAPDLSSIPIPFITSLSSDFVITDIRFRGEPFDLVMTNLSGGLYATERKFTLPTYPPFVDVRDQAGDPGFMTSVDICPGGDASFVCAILDHGGLVYTQRSTTGAWTAFADLKAQASDPGNIKDHSVSFFNGAYNDPAEQLVHVLVSTDLGGLYHATRRSDGTFSVFEDVKAQAGDPGPVISVATDVNPWRIP